MKDLYLAGPLFNEEDNKELDIVEKAATEAGLTFYSPRIECKCFDSQFAKLKGIKPEDMTEEQLKLRNNLANSIYNLNINSINDSRFVLANIRDNDRGTIWEMGYAVGKNIPVISYSFKKYGANMMISQSVIKHLENTTMDNLSELIQVLNDIKSNKDITTIQYKQFAKEDIQ